MTDNNVLDLYVKISGTEDKQAQEELLDQALENLREEDALALLLCLLCEKGRPIQGIARARLADAGASLF